MLCKLHLADAPTKGTHRLRLPWEMTCGRFVVVSEKCELDKGQSHDYYKSY